VAASPGSSGSTGKHCSQIGPWEEGEGGASLATLGLDLMAADLTGSFKCSGFSLILRPHTSQMGFPGGSEVKASTCNAGDLGSIPGTQNALSFLNVLPSLLVHIGDLIQKASPPSKKHSSLYTLLIHCILSDKRHLNTETYQECPIGQYH